MLAGPFIQCCLLGATVCTVCCVQLLLCAVCSVQRLMRRGSQSLGEPQRTPPPCCCCLLLGVAARLNRSQPPSSAQCCLRAATNSLSTYLPFHLHSTSLSDQANTRASTCVLYKCNLTPEREKAAAEIQLVVLWLTSCCSNRECSSWDWWTAERVEI